MSNLMEQLNEAQLEAVMHKDGPLLIVAGAGTGKTHLLTQKIGYMIEQGWAESDQILALTFTDKAANEMEERVDRLLPMGYFDLWILTFHGFAEKIIKTHGLDIGLPVDYKLLNDFEQWILVNKNLDKFELAYYRPAGNPSKFIDALLRHFSRLKDENISPLEYLEYTNSLLSELQLAKGIYTKVENSTEGLKLTRLHQLRLQMALDDVTDEMLEQEVLRLHEVARAYAVYQQLLLDNASLDFGDLIVYCLKLFRERPYILAQYQEQFKFILVDEFQDTNWAQYELVKLLSAKSGNLIVVGDDDQAIYRFRGASMSNILQFKKDFPRSRQVVLVENYRSCQAILDLSYDFVKLNNPNRLEAQFALIENEKPLLKKLIASRSEKAEIEVIEGTNLEDEVSLVINKIVELKSSNGSIGWGDFAILVRANDSAKDFCALMEKLELPYQFIASKGLYVKPLIMDIMAYLQLLDDYHESRALYRVLNMKIWTFTEKELIDFNFAASKKSISLYEVLLTADKFDFTAKTKDKIIPLLDMIKVHTEMAREKNANEVVLAFVNDSGLLKEVVDQPGVQAKEDLAYLNQFMKRVKAFEQGSADKKVKSLVTELAMEIQAGEQGALAIDVEVGPDTIKVMTVHGSKGLEFKHVFIVNLVDKRFPAISRSEAISIPSALIKEQLPAGNYHLEEERRLFYVAMTRAKDGLFFSWASDYGGARKKKPSRFLIETGLVQDSKEPKIKKTATLTEDIFQKATSNKIVVAENFVLDLSYVSYSQIEAYNKCPYQYRFAHILKIPIRGKGVFSFGKTMHAVLQKTIEKVRERQNTAPVSLFDNQEKNDGGVVISLDEIFEIYKESWLDDWYSNAEQRQEYYDKGLQILTEFYHKFKDQWPDNILTEKKFNLKIVDGADVYTVRGAIDRVDRADDGWRIIDYKTGNPKDKLTFDEKKQLLIYQLAVRDLFKEKVVGLVFYYLENNTEVEFIGTEQELEKVVEEIKATVQEIKKGDFSPTPSPLCKFCDFFDICEFRKG
ncbi:MAG: UvrD-helicase domain-containing protein [bacterium]